MKVIEQELKISRIITTLSQKTSFYCMRIIQGTKKKYSVSGGPESHPYIKYNITYERIVAYCTYEGDNTEHTNIYTYKRNIQKKICRQMIWM
jgi:hypothetical protein